ncbi:hypothetical protein BWD42_05185 [Sphingobacterium sp. CZ-UAM]|uniref:serine hydrolase domain-containing protein n=1 Tax=Sphingobacterium sp. CZ-UAM TaxID=1933868 RepID=UPI0009859422|nr:serine hydrolase domain-containing protein [Sphingobacterium sp. CZ-UAM]OOG19333.1 hypothetical protein BWD42_05185 [Sphingobacterium sp. CZ-UAM]
MKIKFLIWIFFTLTWVKIYGQATVDKDSLSTKKKQLNEYFTALTKLKQFNGNLVVVKDRNPFFKATYNIPDGPNELKIKKESKFIIASVSKVFVKYGILKLVQQNKIALNDKLSKFFPGFADGDKITVKHLMHHQSGLPREIKDYEKFDKISGPQLIELAKKEQLLFEPGTKTLYSNIGFLLLHNIIERISDHGYLSFIQQEIFNPMKLRNTSEYNDQSVFKNFAPGFENDEGKIIKSTSTSLDRFETGNYLSTISDLYKFSQTAFNGEHLPRDLSNELFDENDILAQAGGRPGYRAYFYKNKKSGYDFIFLSNYTDMPFQSITADVVKILDGKPYEIPKRIERKAITISSDKLQKYEGKYVLEVDNNQYFMISSKNGALDVIDNAGEITTFYPDSEFTFFQDASSKDGLVFEFDSSTGNPKLTIISSGLFLKTNRLK